MKKYLIVIGGGLFLLAIFGFLGLYIWMDQSVKENIAVAKSKYSGTAEHALISFLMDEENSTNDKTHIAIWTLGQIHSEKALPILKGLYEDDPEGKSCYGHHNTELCQYEIYKAIVALEGSRFLSHARLNN